MRPTDRVFHLAVPCADLGATVDYYQRRLGCRLARRYDDRVTFDFFGDQLVCHLAPDEIETAPKMYPRHFGVTFLDRADFEAVLAAARGERLPFFAEPSTRFTGLPEEHRTFCLIDPANNLIEFKLYVDDRMVY